MLLRILTCLLILSFSAVSVHSKICLWIRGRVYCPDSNNNHDGRTVVVRFTDARRGTLDSGFASKSGRFALYGCHHSTSISTFSPEVHILHNCKQNQQRRITIPVQHTGAHEYNITSMIDLTAYYESETPAPVDLTPPCLPD